MECYNFQFWARGNGSFYMKSSVIIGEKWPGNFEYKLRRKGDYFFCTQIAKFKYLFLFSIDINPQGLLSLRWAQIDYPTNSRFGTLLGKLPTRSKCCLRLENQFPAPFSEISVWDRGFVAMIRVVFPYYGNTPHKWYSMPFFIL